jgi:hypothetical protein
VIEDSAPYRAQDCDGLPQVFQKRCRAIGSWVNVPPLNREIEALGAQCRGPVRWPRLRLVEDLRSGGLGTGRSSLEIQCRISDGARLALGIKYGPVSIADSHSAHKERTP